MKFSTTLVFSTLFIAVLGVYLKWAPPLQVESERPVAVSPKPIAKDFMKFRRNDQIVWLRIQSFQNQQIIALERENDRWMLKLPIVFEADAMMVEMMLKKLALTAKVRYSEPEGDWSEYGLSKPQLKIGLQVAHNSAKKYLLFGDPAPIDGKTYAKWEGDKNYFLLDPGIQKVFEQSVYNLADKRIFQVLNADIEQLIIRMDSEDSVIVNQPDSWLWEKPDSLKKITVSLATMREILAPLQNLFIKDFVEAGEEKQIDRKIFRENFIEVRGAAGKHDVLYLGKEFPNRDAFYGMKNDRDVVFLVDRNNIRLFLEAIEALKTASTVASD